MSCFFQSEAINPVALRLDMLFPTKQPELLEDMVAIHFAFYKDKDTSAPESLETYTDPDGVTYKVSSKANYLEFITMRKTSGQYKVDLSTSGISPEIIALSNDKMTTLYSGPTTLGHGLGFEFDMSGDRNQATPSLKLMYIYRNGYSPGNTYFGKNVAYKTERFSAILDFSQIDDYKSLITGQPAACRRNAGTERLDVIQNLRWEKGVAFVDARELEKGDRVRVFWNWRNTPEDKKVDCASAMR